MQKLKIKITGSKVHDVGYRVFLVNKALSLGVNNFNAFNTYFDDTQTVIAIIEANDEAIEEFKNYVTSFRPKEASTENISFEDYRNTVPPIERLMQSFQMEQWGKGIPILLQISEKLDNNTSILKENTSILKDFKNETNENFGRLTDIMTKHDVDAQERIAYLTTEISGIKERLSRLESAIG